MLPQIYPTAPDENGRPRIRTFHGRRGRISQTRAKAFTDLVPKYLLSIDQVPLDLRKVFASDEVFLDFGCGMGGHTIDLLNRGVSVVAIDVHTAGICDLATFAQLKNNQNLRLFHGDGIELLQKLTPKSIAQIDVYFPDPWPKARHAKRRLFNRGFLELCAKVLKPNGRVVLITDDDNYAFEATEVIKNQEIFQLVPFAQQVTMTSFHNRALKLGHQIHKFELTKN
jgi:tRNA (guanine-N7-)-methyltransferase